MADDDDEELRRAIALSLQDQNGREVIDLDSYTSEAPTGANIENGDPPFLLGLNRKQMEQERLARRRKRSVSPPLAHKRQKPSDITVSQHSAGASSSNNAAVFQRATVKKTWAFGHARIGDDIKLEEVFQKNDLSLAVLCSFQWDMEWLMAKLTGTQMTLVMQAKDQATKDQYRRETADIRNLRLCFPSMDGQVNCMHSKLMLLSHPTYLRIAVPTANLVAYDWGESGQMENSVFLVDLPRRPLDGQSGSSTHQTAFERELVYFLRAMDLEESLIESISDFDFTATKDLAFVHTIGGPHVGESWRRTGYCGLGRAIQELGLETQNAIDLDFVTSSVGSLNVDFLTMLYLAAQGDDGTKEYGWRNPETGKDRIKRSKAEIERREYEMQIIKINIHKNFRIYFPTQDTVKSSTAGYAGTICFPIKMVQFANIPSTDSTRLQEYETRSLDAQQGQQLYPIALHFTNMFLGSDRVRPQQRCRCEDQTGWSMLGLHWVGQLL